MEQNDFPARLPHILLVAANEEGRGSGHAGRQAALARDLRAAGRQAWLYLEGSGSAGEAALKSAGFDPQWLLGKGGIRNLPAVDFVVLDRFQTPEEEFLFYKNLAPVIGIDEGGPCRGRFDFLIDILVPKNSAPAHPNIADPSLLDLPPKKTRENRPVKKILISFGREDSAGLGAAVFDAFVQKKRAGIDIGLADGGIADLKNRLHEYDLVITHYGITAYEAVYAGCAVALVSPSALHEKLSLKAGFFSAGSGKKASKKLAALLFEGGGIKNGFWRLLQDRALFLAKKHSLDKEPEKTLAALIGGFSPSAARACPLCAGAAAGSVIARFSDRTYRLCEICRGVYLDRLAEPPVEYAREYFFDFYKKQYGKTYMEDFPNLKNAGRRRLGVIKAFLPEGGAKTLLDIGCAYGPFLQAAKDEGFAPFGIDPAQEAAGYVNGELGIPAACGLFPACDLPQGAPEKFAVITMWFVIEHFKDCAPVFAEVKKRLASGGVFAFSTPSASGISGRFSLRRFLRNSPADHFTVWSFSQCKKALKRHGFVVKKRAISSHHPQRFPLIGRFAKKKNPLYWALLGISKLFALGDTFEVYAVVPPEKGSCGHNRKRP